MPDKLSATPRTSPVIPIRPTLTPATARSSAKTRGSLFSRPIRLAFPRRSASPADARRRGTSRSLGGRGKTRQTESAPEGAFAANWVLSASTSASPEPQPYLCLQPPTVVAAAGHGVQPTHVRVETVKGVAAAANSTLTEDDRPRRKRLRTARDWFSPGKLFASVMPSS